MTSPSCGTGSELYDDFMNCTSYELAPAQAEPFAPLRFGARPYGLQNVLRQDPSPAPAGSGQAKNNNITTTPAHPREAEAAEILPPELAAPTDENKEARSRSKCGVPDLGTSRRRWGTPP